MERVLDPADVLDVTDWQPLLEAAQQPHWEDLPALWEARIALIDAPPLVSRRDVELLHAALADVARGRRLVVQAGDCAEDPAECTPDGLARKVELIQALADALSARTGRPVLRVGRIAGQFAKPRSRPTELVGDVALPVFRGHLVNSPAPDGHARRADPRRLVTCYRAAAAAVRTLGWSAADDTAPGHVLSRVWTSHEALVLDYEVPLLRGTPMAMPLLSSTHWPWIGERTRGVGGAHVDLLAQVCNPVACKIGPSTTPEELVALCRRLDPLRTPGRLTFIARLGADAVVDRLPRLVRAARQANHPVIWLLDPMHGNTVPGPGGRKTRFLDSILREVRAFLDVVEDAGGTAGGLHLEVTPDPVTECVRDATELHRVPQRYTSLCDPRLNPEQALLVARSWRRRP